MGPFGFQELLVILIIILLLFGAKKLPELARGLGKSVSEFRHAQDEVKEEFKKAMEEEPVKKDQAKAASKGSGEKEKTKTS